MVLQAAVELSTDPLIRFAALVHDLGKACTPMNEWPSHHGHEERGVAVIECLCQRLRIPVEYRTFAVMVSRVHLNIHRLFELQPKTIVKILEQTDAFRRPQRFEQLLIVCQADALGVGRKVNYQQGVYWRILLEECNKITAQNLIQQGYQGEAIKLGLHQQRVDCVERLKTMWKN